MNNENLIVLPNEYLTKTPEELVVIARKIKEKLATDLFMDETYNVDFSSKEDEFEAFIMMSAYIMFIADGKVNDAEDWFMREVCGLPADEFDDGEPEESVKIILDTLKVFNKTEDWQPYARGLIRIAAIAAVIDNGSINAQESRLLKRMLNCVGL